MTKKERDSTTARVSKQCCCRDLLGSKSQKATESVVSKEWNSWMSHLYSAPTRSPVIPKPAPSDNALETEFPNIRLGTNYPGLVP